jgi:hypothetical protein
MLTYAQVLAGELQMEHVLLRQVETDVCSRMQLDNTDVC